MVHVWAAIRYRRAQAAALMLLSALIATCAALAPLYTRALEQGLLRQAVFEAAPADTALTVKATRTPTAPDLALARLTEVVPPGVRDLHEPGIGTYNGQVVFEVFPNRPGAPVDLIYRDRMCERVVVTAGTCPAAQGEIAVTAAEAAFWKWKPGDRFTVTERDAPTGAAPQTLTVVGVYEQVPDDAYWMRLKLDGRSGGTIDGGDTPALDSWITAAQTFDGAWGKARLTVQYPLDRAGLTLDDVPRAASAIAATRADSGTIEVESPMANLLTGIRDGQEQVRLVVPLLMAQLGLLAAVVLLSVAAAAVEQRRPEVALARLRGRSRGGARWLVVGELGLTVLLGLPVGLAIAVAVNEGARRLLLPPGVPFEFPVGVLGALLTAGLVAMGAVWLAAQPVLNEPISSLLRRVAQARASRRLPVVDIVVAALATAGLVGLATTSDAGPLALMTPTLLSLAAGLVVAHVLVRAAASTGAANVRRGRVGPALTAYQLARRPAVRKVLTIITVATALAVFAANAVTVADRNREARAQLEAGAPAVLLTDAVEPASLQRALARVDPTGGEVTPVAIVRPRDVAATATMAVVPRGFDAVAFPPPHQEALELAALAPPAVDPVRLDGSTLSLTVEPSLTVAEAGGEAAAQAGRVLLGIVVTTPDGQRLTRDLGAVPLGSRRPVALAAPVLCPDGCRLDSLTVRADLTPSGPRGNPWEANRQESTAVVRGQLVLAGMALDGRPLDIGAADRWQPSLKVDAAPDDRLRAAGGSSADRLVLDVVSSGVVLGLAHADVPASVPAILAGPVPPGGTVQQFTASGLAGLPTTMTRTQQSPALPVLGERGVLVNYETLGRLGGRLAGSGSLQAWLGSDSPAMVDKTRKALSDSGINVLAVRTYADAKQAYDRSAAGWGLQLALVTGVLALLMAALSLVVVAATGWRAVARDFAAMRMAGVPLPVLRRAARTEQLVVVGVGVGVGAVSGLLGAHLAMPLIPLFNRPAPVPALDLSPAWPAAAGAILVALVLLGLVGLLVARALGTRFTLGRIRELL
jgi:putative ABC transport system permease protein